VSVNDGAKEVDNGEDFDGVQFAYFQYFHYNFTVTEMHCVRSNAMRPLTDRFGSTVVLLNELFVTVHVDDILNT